jgi:hypothetical protein
MGRGPSYPYVDLEQGIALAKKMYDYTKRAPAPLESVVQEAWKYTATSSSGQKVLAALKSYGLVEDAPGTNGKALKLTQRAIRILLDEENSVERREEIKKAALAPKWYDFCWRTWGAEMPTSMRSNLLIEHGFVDSTVEGFLKDYKKTVAFVGLTGREGFREILSGSEQSAVVSKVGDYIQWESQGVLRMPEAKKLVRFEGEFAFVEGSLTGIPIGEVIPAEAPEEKPLVPQNIFVPAITMPVVKGDTNMGTESFVLSEGGFTLQLSWPSKITEEGFEDFLYQLEGLKKKVQRAVRKDVAGV